MLAVFRRLQQHLKFVEACSEYAIHAIRILQISEHDLAIHGKVGFLPIDQLIGLVSCIAYIDTEQSERC